jgi:hypothetical protein
VETAVGWVAVFGAASRAEWKLCHRRRRAVIGDRGGDAEPRAAMRAGRERVAIGGDRIGKAGTRGNARSNGEGLPGRAIARRSLITARSMTSSRAGTVASFDARAASSSAVSSPGSAARGFNQRNSVSAICRSSNGFTRKSSIPAARHFSRTCKCAEDKANYNWGGWVDNPAILKYLIINF